MIRLLGVADVGQQAEELHAVDQAPAGVHATLDPERDDAAEAAREVALGEFMARVGVEARVADPCDLGPLLQPLGDRQCVLAVTLDPQRERLEALEEQEGVERAERRPEIAETLDPQLEDERQRPKPLT